MFNPERFIHPTNWNTVERYPALAEQASLGWLFEPSSWVIGYTPNMDVEGVNVICVAACIFFSILTPKFITIKSPHLKEQFEEIVIPLSPLLKFIGTVVVKSTNYDIAKNSYCTTLILWKNMWKNMWKKHKKCDMLKI